MTIDTEMKLRLLPCSFSICRSGSEPKLPGNAAPLGAILYDGKVYTWIGPQDSAPVSEQSQSGFRALEVQGPLDFGLTGVIAGISAVLAEAGVPIFVLSSYDTDYILVRTTVISKAVNALKQAGYEVAH